MVRTGPLALAVALTVLPFAARAQTPTLADVVRASLVRNERSEQASLGVVSAEAGVRRARAAFLPTLSLGASETIRPYTAGTNLRETAASGTLTLNQTLLNAAAFPLYASARHSYESSRYTEVDQRRKIASDAAQAFFTVIAQQRILQAAKARLERSDATLRDTQARAAAELVSSNDVTRSVVERASALQSVATAQSGLEQARLSLGYIVNLEISADLSSPDASLSPFALDPGTLVKLAVAQRPDLKASAESVQAAEAAANEPGLRFVPTLSASGQVRVADQTIAGNRHFDETVGINLNWAIWDAGVRSADADSRGASAKTAELQRRALVRQIAVDVRQAISALLGARSVLAAAQDGLQSAQRNVEETNVLYKQGLAKAIELVDANASRFDAEVSLAAAQLETRRAELDLRSALGLFPVDGVR